jgi:hypothetical protein
MASSSSTYLLPGPSSTVIGSKSILIKQSSPTVFHPVRHQFPYPLHRPPVSSHSHQQIVKSIPANDTFHTNTNNGTSLLTSNNNDDSSGGGGSNGHSLSQSMESINNIGLTDDEVRQRYVSYCLSYTYVKILIIDYFDIFSEEF